MKRVAVLGAGVIGMSCAYRILSEIGNVQVSVIAEDLTPNTTSDGSAGFWEPYCLSDTHESLILKWSAATYDYLMNLALSEEATAAGISIISGTELSQVPVKEPFWKDVVLHFHRLSPSELQHYPSAADGFFYTTITCEPIKYLPWLMQRFTDLGGQIMCAKVTDMRQVCQSYDIVINCTGLGSLQLLNDQNLYPVRGQVIKVNAPWLKHFRVETKPDGRIYYILPGQNVVTLGGTHDVGQWDRTVNTDIKQDILEGCCRLEPSLKNATVIKDWVGLRPARSQVRLEMESVSVPGRVVKVIHNYGHGGAGVTLHWGCAGLVCSLLQQAFIAEQSKL